MLEPIGGRSKSSPKEVGVIGAISAQKHVENPALNRGIGSTAEQQTTTIYSINKGAIEKKSQ
jgi:hypothetical protein